MQHATPAFRVGEREKKILRALARFRFLSFPQVAQLDGGSVQQLTRRLRLMLLHELIAEPATATAKLRLVTLPRVFALAKAGADILAREDGTAPDRRSLKKKNSKATTDLVAHTLDIADTMIAFEEHAQRLNISLVDYQHLLMHFPVETRAAVNPLSLTLTRISRNDVPHSVIPDRIFSLVTSDMTRNNFTLEEDTGHMPVRRKKLTGTSSFAKKAYVYWQAWRTEEHTRRWGFQRFRVLTVTRSEDRITTMIDRTLEITERPTGLFLFTTKKLIAEHGPFAPIWFDLHRKRVPLFTPAPAAEAAE